MMSKGDIAAAPGQALLDSAVNLRNTMDCPPFGIPMGPHAGLPEPAPRLPRAITRAGGIR